MSEISPIRQDYLDRLPEAGRQDLVQAAAQAQPLSAEDPASATIAARLAMRYPDPAHSPLVQEAQHVRVAVAPVPRRTSMVPRQWGILNPFSRWLNERTRRFDQRTAQREAETHIRTRKVRPRKVSPVSPDAPDPVGYWQRRGNARRLVLLGLMLAQTALATFFMRNVLPYHGEQFLEKLILVLFALLFCWVSAGFWTAVAGFWLLMTGRDRFLSARAAGDKDIDASARTAIVMPICNEDVARVFAGLKATYQSLQRTGDDRHFDFFVLSDSNQADICVAESQAWSRLCEEVKGFGRIFYRHRRRRVKRKSGNIDDFCRRWGSQYRYMVVLDADSVMSGTSLTTLVRMMEAQPGAGIIQTAPKAVGRESLYARIQQFSTSVYGPLFTTGLYYWQLGESHYWGHNAIIRLAPFMEHCALAPLPGDGPMSGPIMSHDFVEAALMRRAGWSVWIAYDLDGSYEEMPSNLLEELGRDRRWCQGNLMNFRLFLVRGMHAVHRAVFITGVMAYASAPLWCLFLILSTVLLGSHVLISPTYFVEPWQLFPIWPEWHPEEAIALMSATATLLFLPKVLSVVLILARGARAYGGALRVTLSVLLEMLFSVLLAPVRMLFHTRFVVGAMLGWTISWKSPSRADNQTTWREGVGAHGMQALIGIGWGTLIWWLDASAIWWSLPIVGSLAIAWVTSVLSSRVSLGHATARMKLFMIPEETTVPQEIKDMQANLAHTAPAAGFMEAVVDPLLNAQLCAQRRYHAQLPPVISRRAQKWIDKAVSKGPQSLSEAEKLAILGQPAWLSRLHHAVWHAAHVHPAWELARH